MFYPRSSLPLWGWCMLLLAVLTACGTSAKAPAPATVVPAAPAVQAAVGLDAPGFTLPSTTGPQVSLSDYRGKPVIVEFLATW